MRAFINRGMAARSLAALLIAWALIGCGDDEQRSSAPRGIPGRAGPESAAVPQNQAAHPSRSNAPRDSRRVDPAEAAQAARRAATTEARGSVASSEASRGASAAEESPDAQHASALRALIGDPSPCLVGLPEADKLRLTVSATVVASGRITRSELRPSLPRQIQQCLMSRVSGASLPGPIENAPKTVTTQLELEWQGTEASP